MPRPLLVILAATLGWASVRKSRAVASRVEKLLRRGAAVYMAIELLEKPLSEPADERHVEARLLEALIEARLALRLLQEGLTCNAACKAFQAWKALLAALLRLELDKLKAVAKSGEERRWLKSKAVPRVPTSRMLVLSLLLEKAGHDGVA